MAKRRRWPEAASGSALELGCGVGRFSRYVAQQGLRATGVDFSPVAIAKAQKNVAQYDVRPQFLVGDVTELDVLSGRSTRSHWANVSRLMSFGATYKIDESALDIDVRQSDLDPVTDLNSLLSAHQLSLHGRLE